MHPLFGSTLIFLLMGASMVTFAERPAFPASTPMAYQAECGSCHVAFPPRLLAAEDWRRVMGKLDQHYGDNASLDEKTRRVIEDFLVQYGGDLKRLGRDGAASDELPRLTATAWFKREHREVPLADWVHPKVRTPANCAACHTRAAEGSYREREIVMPTGRRVEDEDD